MKARLTTQGTRLPAIAEHQVRRPAQQQPAFAAGWITGSPFASGSLVFTRLDDRAVHAVGDLVRELDRDVLEAGRLEPGLVLALRERAGDAADVAAALGALVGREPVLGDDVADPDPPARLAARGAISVSTAGLSTERLITQFEITTSTESGRERDLLDHALEEVHVRDARPRAALRCASASISSVMSSP